MDNKEYLNAERAASWREALRKSKPNKDRINISRTEMNELTPDYRITCNEEVNQGLTREQALIEASRCLDCPDPLCITGCPVGINIPKFIKNIERGEILEAAKTLKETSALPAVCGRVCPQARFIRSANWTLTPASLFFVRPYFSLYSRNRQARYSFSFSLSRCLAKLMSKCSTGYSVHSVSSFSMASPLKRSFFPAKKSVSLSGISSTAAFPLSFAFTVYAKEQNIYFRNLNRIIFFII